MAVHESEIVLPAQSPGARHRLLSYTFVGREADTARSVYIHAGLHADEHPGLLVVQHLLSHLNRLEQDGLLRGTVTVRPYANPVGMGQQVFGHLTGRFNFDNGENFNRHFPDLVDDLKADIAASPIARNDLAAIRERFEQLLEPYQSQDTVAACKYHLLNDALQHDLVLDLHCDSDAELHIYSTTNQRDRTLRLARCMGIEAVFLEDDSGGDPFDEAFSKPWRVLQEAGVVDVDHLGYSCTVELRGQADVSDELAETDAAGILRFLAEEGVIEADGAPAATGACEPRIYPLTGVAPVKAGIAGIVVYRKQLGEPVTKGEVFAEVVPLDQGIDPTREVITSPVDGVVVVRHLTKLVRSGQKIALLAGTEPLASRRKGNLLGD